LRHQHGAAHPQTKIQLCIVHMARNALRCAVWKDRKVSPNDQAAMKVVWLTIEAAARK